jgi:hypothetical protein
MEQLSTDDVAWVRLQRDKATIRECLEYHFHGLDIQDVPGIHTRVYTPDVHITPSEGEPFVGFPENWRDGVVGMFKASHHLPCTVDIEVDGDTASTRTFAIAFLKVANGDEGDAVYVRGLRYDHTWRRVGNGWRSDRFVQQALWQFDVPAVEPHLPSAAR